jgi:hypothetical protein
MDCDTTASVGIAYFDCLCRPAAIPIRLKRFKVSVSESRYATWFHYCETGQICMTTMCDLCGLINMTTVFCVTPKLAAAAT